MGPLLAALACSSGEGAEPSSEHPAVRSTTPIFVDRSAEAGVDFVHWNGMTGQLYFHEIVGSGAAVFDADGDEDLDLWLVQGDAVDDLAPLDPPPERRGDRLYRNEGPGPDGIPRFVDVSEEAGLGAPGYGMGVTTGDVDNDGDVDVYTTGFEANRLWINAGDGRFVERAAEAGVGDDRWSTSASFVDLDRDGRLDLYVANYVDFRVARHKQCHAPSGHPDYCGPKSYSGVADSLFLNRTTERDRPLFVDVSAEVGLHLEPSSGLGVVAADFDGDGWSDLYVANDQRPNLLWRNHGVDERGRPILENVALLNGAAVNRDGVSEASMGVEAADFDADGDLDLFMTHLRSETNTLLENQGDGTFVDRSRASRLGPMSLGATGFGTAALDFDGDGLLDVVVANGSVTRLEELVAAGDPFPLHMPNALFRNLDGGRFEEVRGPAAAALHVSHVSRGIARGDLDSDGDLDLVITNTRGPARILLNEFRRGDSWIGLRPMERGRDALGATLRLDSSGGRAVRRAQTDGSYCSAHDPRVLFPLAEGSGPVEVEVRWVDGESERWEGLEPGRYHRLERGTAP